ncbi:hypothetical protein JNUCC42_13335 [Brevibacterium sp. JNUCC-42]|nr:hypothetical protein JNUCC42_13335 [Brevibacterium sp. JNUCC-42]
MEKQVAIEPTFEEKFEILKRAMNTAMEYWREVFKKIQVVFRENPLFAELYLTYLTEVKQDRKKQRQLYYRKKRSQARKKWRK